MAFALKNESGVSGSESERERERRRARENTAYGLQAVYTSKRTMACEVYCNKMVLCNN